MGTVYNEKGHEVPDRTPVALPVGYRTPEPLQEMIRRLVRVESVRAQRQGMESFEEADDFEVPEGEPEFTSEHQMKDMEEELPTFSEKELIHNPTKEAVAKRRKEDEEVRKQNARHAQPRRAKEEVEEEEAGQ